MSGSVTAAHSIRPRRRRGSCPSARVRGHDAALRPPAVEERQVGLRARPCGASRARSGGAARRAAPSCARTRRCRSRGRPRARPRRLGVALARGWSISVDDRPRQRAGVALRHDQRVAPSVEDVEQAVGVGRDDRLAHRQRLEHRQRRALPERRKHAEVERRDDARRRRARSRRSTNRSPRPSACACASSASRSGPSPTRKNRASRPRVEDQSRAAVDQDTSCPSTRAAA